MLIRGEYFFVGSSSRNSDLKYKFVERVVEGVTYYQIQSTTTTNYLYRENYNTKWTADLSAVAEENTLFQIVQTGNLNTPKYVFLKIKRPMLILDMMPVPTGGVMYIQTKAWTRQSIGGLLKNCQPDRRLN